MSGTSCFRPVWALHTFREIHLYRRTNRKYHHGVDRHHKERPFFISDWSDVDRWREVFNLPFIEPGQRQRNKYVLYRNGKRQNYPSNWRIGIGRHLSGQQIEPHVHQPEAKRQVEHVCDEPRPFLCRREKGGSRTTGWLWDLYRDFPRRDGTSGRICRRL